MKWRRRSNFRGISLPWWDLLQVYFWEHYEWSWFTDFFLVCLLWYSGRLIIFLCSILYHCTWSHSYLEPKTAKLTEVESGWKVPEVSEVRGRMTLVNIPSKRTKSQCDRNKILGSMLTVCTESTTSWRELEGHMQGLSKHYAMHTGILCNFSTLCPFVQFLWCTM